MNALVTYLIGCIGLIVKPAPDGIAFAGPRVPPSVQVLLLGTLFCALAPVVYLPIICAADALKVQLERRPRLAPAIKCVSGLLLVSVVALLALS